MGEGHKGKYIYTPFTYIHLYIYMYKRTSSQAFPLFVATSAVADHRRY